MAHFAKGKQFGEKKRFRTQACKLAFIASKQKVPVNKHPGQKELIFN